jgi:hypothetical protein
MKKGKSSCYAITSYMRLRSIFNNKKITTTNALRREKERERNNIIALNRLHYLLILTRFQCTKLIFFLLFQLSVAFAFFFLFFLFRSIPLCLTHCPCVAKTHIIFISSHILCVFFLLFSFLLLKRLRERFKEKSEPVTIPICFTFFYLNSA